MKAHVQQPRSAAAETSAGQGSEPPSGCVWTSWTRSELPGFCCIVGLTSQGLMDASRLPAVSSRPRPPTCSAWLRLSC